MGLLAGLMVLASTFGGMPYLWCVPMARARLACCCPARSPAVHAESAAHAQAPSARAAVVARSCCEGRRVAALPATNVALHADVSVPPPGLVALLPLALLLAVDGAPTDQHLRAYGRQARAGPEPPLFELHRRYLN
jgi:hypothetical protein